MNNWKEELKEAINRQEIEVHIFNDEKFLFDLFPHSRYAKRVIDAAKRHPEELNEIVKETVDN